MKPICTFPRCPAPEHARGLCNSHYWRWLKGKPLTPIDFRIRDPLERFWSRVDKAGPVIRPELGPCWIWTAKRERAGYGRISWRGRVQPAHRVAYELIVGPIPDGLELDHLCVNPPCVNPAHLEPVTHLINILRSATALPAQRARQTHCKRGHPLIADNLYKVAGRPTKRLCKECQKMRQRAYNRSAKAELS